MRVFVLFLGFERKSEEEEGEEEDEERERENSEQPLIFERAERATSGLKFKRFRGLFGFALEGPLRGDKCLSILHSDNSHWTFSRGRGRVYPAFSFVLAGLGLRRGDFAMEVRSQISFFVGRGRLSVSVSLSPSRCCLRASPLLTIITDSLSFFLELVSGPSSRTGPVKTIAFLLLFGPVEPIWSMARLISR